MSVDRKVSVEDAVREAIAGSPPVVLAVSGGRDSMALLVAAARRARAAVAAVATFDHRTGAWASRAAAAVASAARALELPVVSGAAASELRGASEAELREARWRFLRSVADGFGARVATGHTRSDHVETIAMRVLRGAGARGLAGLDVDSPLVVRPLLRVSRADTARYVERHRISCIEDPSNESLAGLRNRLRLQLLPALERAHPGFAAELLDIGRRAAEWRRGIDAVAAGVPQRLDGGSLRVAADALADYDSASLGVLWPALAARAGVTLDHRGTRRLVEFTRSSRTGDWMPVSGGVSVVRSRDEFHVHARLPETSPDTIALGRDVRFGRWRIRETRHWTAGDSWSTQLPSGRAYVVRAWRPGDRMRTGPLLPARKVKRFFAEAGVPGPERIGWPVIVDGDEVVWIPGVRAANPREDIERLTYVCEPTDG